MKRLKGTLIALMVLSSVGCAEDDEDGADHSLLQQNEALIRSGFELLNAGDMTAFMDLYGPAYVYHGPSGDLDAAGFQSMVQGYLTGLPDLTFTIVRQIAEKNLVVTRWSATGIHTGDFPDLPATGRTSTVSGLTMSSIVDGKVVEVWENWDEAGMLRQLGVLPSN